MRRAARLPAVLALTALTTLSGCSMGQGLTGGGGGLPFAKGAGEDSYQVQVTMANIANLVPNAEVKVNDVTVGAVTGIALKDWQAQLTVSLADDVRLPANTIANVAQKSLLGAQYLELSAPTGGAVGRLTDGSVIPVERTGTYPATEDLLIAVSTLLNGSGLTQLKSITLELNRALDGRTDDIRALLEHIEEVSAKLSDQRATIARLLERLDELSETMVAQTPRLERALPDLAPGLAALDAQRPALTRALKAVDQLDAVTRPVLAANRTGLTQEIRDLRPVLARVADAGDDVTGSLNYLGTVIFPLDRIDSLFHGDYMNLFMKLDLRDSTNRETLLSPPSVVSSSTGSVPTTAELFAPTTRAGTGTGTGPGPGSGTAGR